MSAVQARAFIGTPLFDGQGKVMGALGIMHGGAIREPDIARELMQLFAVRTSAELERRRHDAELAAMTSDLENRVQERTAQLAMQALAMETTIEGMAVLKDGCYIYMNKPHAAMYGFLPGDLIGERWERLYEEDERARIQQLAFPALERDLRWRGEVTGLRRDGSLFAAEISLAATHDGHLICSCRDITIADAARKTLDERSQMLERASRAKDDFLASMSHELRTPLAGILMITESLRRNTYGPLTPRQTRVLAHLEESGRHLLDLINDILDLSKIEAGKLDLAIEDVPALELAEAAMRMIREPAGQKNISLAMTVEPPDLVIRADARRLKQMLLNLLGNGVKFTPQGGHVALDIEVSPDRAFVLLHVSDTGIGIDPDTFDKLFKPFVQVDSGLARQYGGTGLGLPLVLRMAELHQGGVTVESRLGSGSTFTIRLPHQPTTDDSSAANAPATAASSKPASPLHGRLLVVEDNPITLTVLNDYLAARGFTVQTATSGAIAVMNAVADPPDLVLMDIQMPGMDGFEATRLLRNQSNPRIAQVPIIALTALAMPGDRERCLLAGMNHYVTKPVQLETLAESITMLLRTDNRSPATTPAQP
jgi:PAS domain S-box-containing protein